ncbi:hypothetical protein FOZ63_007442, partial [Perkinsus olseni]
LVEAVLKFHPSAERKLAGMTGIKVDVSPYGDTHCFYVMRENGESEDISVVKCFNNMQQNPPYINEEDSEKKEAAPAEKSSVLVTLLYVLLCLTQALVWSHSCGDWGLSLSRQGAITTLQQMSRTPITGQLLVKGGMAAVVGAVLGIIISLVVNCTLVEISMSAFFALYFGLLFISVGCVILWRISTQAQMVSTAEETARKKQLQLFASLIVVSGFLCFILEKNWFVGMSPVLKIPLYSILGVSVSFALTFSVVDMINYLLGFLQVVVARPLVESTSQVYL